MRNRYFRNLFLCVVLNMIWFPIASAQSKWVVPNLHFLDWKRDTIGGGKTPLSSSERKALVRITGRKIQGCLSDPGPDDPRTFKGNFENLRIKRVLLSRAGLHGLIVQASGVCMCGATGNCDFWLIAERQSGFDVVLQTIGIQSFEITNTTSTGYFDVVLGSHSSATDTDLSLYHYTGSYYRRAACAFMSYQGDHFQTLTVPSITPRSCRGR